MKRVATGVAAAVVFVSCSPGGEPPVGGRAETSAAAPMPDPRTEVAGAAWRGGIVVGGGLLADRTASSRVDLYDPDRDAWERLPDMPRALHHHGYAVVDDELWVVGGFETRNGQWVPTDRVWRLVAPDADWQQGPSLTTPRGGLAVVTTADGAWAIGGVGPNGTHRSTERLVGDAWMEGPDLGETREHLAAAAQGDVVVVIAGRDGGMHTNRATTEVLTIDGVTAGPELAVARGGTAAAPVGDVVCVAGGETTDGTVAEVECLGDDGWTTMARLEQPRHGLAVIALDNRLHVIGGGPTPGLSVSDQHDVIVLP